jgi:hypothetical protein
MAHAASTGKELYSEPGIKIAAMMTINNMDILKCGLYLAGYKKEL